ncbi:MAG: hypothetical protein LBQ06_04930 [Frankiaceae bacterium]|jgi:hypothetical protein|nr:hypothetical protein [Frankiaceae bacterium]
MRSFFNKIFRPSTVITVALCLLAAGCTSTNPVPIANISAQDASIAAATDIPAATDTPPATTAPGPSAQADPARTCRANFGAETANGSAKIDNPSWGPTTVVTCGSSLDPSNVGNSDAPTAAAIFATDANGAVRWSQQYAKQDNTCYIAFMMAKPGTDKSGNIFIRYNRGGAKAYEGVLVLHPTPTGFTPLTSVCTDNGDQTAALQFIPAELVGPGSDGLYAITTHTNNCDPDCADGMIVSTTYRWNGTTYA